MLPLSDRYEIVRRLDAGGSIEFYEAKELGSVGSPWRPQFRPSRLLLRGGPKSVAPPWADPAIARRLVHPNVVRMFECISRDGVGWEAILEFVAGPNLEELAAKKIVSTELACYIAAACCRALTAGLGLLDGGGGRRVDFLHGALSLRLIQLSRHGEVKLGGFALGRLKPELPFDDCGPIWQKEIGRFSAPEQVLRDNSGPETDVFGLGAVLHALLVKGPLIPAPSGHATVAELLGGKSPTLSRLDPATTTVSPALARVLDKALARTRAKRYPSAIELLAALEALPELVNADAAREELARAVCEICPVEP